jgi:hypothetical protein
LLHLSDAPLVLETSARELVAATSERRAALELQGAAAFRAVTQALIDVDAESAIVDLSAKAIVEEGTHSEIYRALAERYRGAPVASPTPEPIRVPRYLDAEPWVRPMLQVVAMCAINETMACSFLELCFEGATDAVVREGIRTVLADEIRHARVGWAFLESRRVDDRARAAISRWLVSMLEAQWRKWTAQIATLPPGGVPEHGCPAGDAITAAALGSVRDVVLPGLDRARLDTRAARAWFDAVVA